MAGIALLSNVTIGAPFLISSLRKSLDRPIILPDGYDTWRQTLLDSSQLPEKPDAIFLVLDGHAYMESINDGDENAIAQKMAMDASVIERFKAENADLPIFVSNMDIPPVFLRAATQPDIEKHAMNLWQTQLERMQVPIINIIDCAAQSGRNNFYSASTWYAGNVPWSMEGQRALAQSIVSLWRSHAGQRKKVLVLDLDNTLWGGVIGEDGLYGILLGRDHMGAAYRDFQRLLKELKKQGVLLAVVSKNNEEDALDAIRSHPDMVLREEDFVAIRANWIPKPENIATLAKDLNLGTDSFIFVDDNPVERAAVRAALPEVVVPEFPDHPSKLPAFAREIASAWFPCIHITKEDESKTETYQAENRRKTAMQESADLTSFLNSLNMILKISPVKSNEVPRIAQLTQKTNQFNLTTKRYTEGDIHRFLQSDEWQIYKGALSDSYGDFGIVLLCLIHFTNQKPEIDSFLMSCRAMGRNAESYFLKHIEKILYKDGYRELAASYSPTRKNKIVENFYDGMGFIPASNSQRYKKELEETEIQMPINITVIWEDRHD